MILNDVLKIHPWRLSQNVNFPYGGKICIFRLYKTKKNQNSYYDRKFRLNNLLFMIDSIFLMVSEIYGSEVIEIAVHRDAIVVFWHYRISNHPEYWIDHGKQNYSERNLGWVKRSEFFFSTWPENPLKWCGIHFFNFLMDRYCLL